MNMLFSIASGLWIVVAFAVAYFLVPANVWAALPDGIGKHRTKAFVTVIGLMVSVVAFRAINTYGPRSTLPEAKIPYPPDATEVSRAPAPFIDRTDRVGQFDSRLNQDVVKKP